LIGPELEELEALRQKHPHLREAFPDGFEDPCPIYSQLLEQFVAWYFLARQRKHTESSIIRVARDGEQLQALLKTTLPNRAGTILSWM
jgi:hypothetical protein